MKIEVQGSRFYPILNKETFQKGSGAVAHGDALSLGKTMVVDKLKDTDAYEMGQMVYLEFRVVLDDKKS